MNCSKTKRKRNSQAQHTDSRTIVSDHVSPELGLDTVGVLTSLLKTTAAVVEGRLRTPCTVKRQASHRDLRARRSGEECCARDGIIG